MMAAWFWLAAISMSFETQLAARNALDVSHAALQEPRPFALRPPSRREPAQLLACIDFMLIDLFRVQLWIASQ
jgi:hypothetical protein